MEKQDLTQMKKDVLIEEYVTLVRENIDNCIYVFNLQKNILTEIINFPNYDDFFSPSEVIDMNQLNRKIPNLIKELVDLKKTVTLENWGTERNQFIDIQKNMFENDKFVDSMMLKLPKNKPSSTFLFALAAPYTFLSNFFKSLLYKIKIIKLEKKNKLLAKKVKK